MDKKDDFELDFDFEKEYGFSPEDIMDPEYDSEEDFDIDLGSDEDYSLEDIQLDEMQLENIQTDDVQFEDEDFGSPEDYKLLEDYEPTLPVGYEEPDLIVDMPVRQEPQPQNSLADEALTYDEFDEIPERNPAAPRGQTSVPPQMPPVVPPVVPPMAPPRDNRRNSGRRQNPLKADPGADFGSRPAQDDGSPVSPTPQRKKRSQMRIIKEDYLPVGIAGVALLLCLTFIIGSVVRTVKNNAIKEQNAITASEQAASEAARLEKEAAELRSAAAELATGYDFEGAIQLLDSFSGNMGNYPEMVSDRSQYNQMLGQMVEITNFDKIPNLSFHVLIADSERAYADEKYGAAYKKNFVTTGEFSKILQQLYDNGYVLVNLDDFIEETVDINGKVNFTTKSIFLPEGKKPVMITETLVNYFAYMVDPDKDGVPDANGGGFANKLVLKDGKITAQMVDASGKTVYGAYDLVPILNDFIEQHPDFSYRGARATLAVTGSEGVFGYRIQNGNEAEINEAKELIQALRDQGYLIACNSYSNLGYAKVNATDIQADLEKWKSEIVPVLGEVDILVYAQSSDIADYNGSKYNVMANAGFHYFISHTTNAIPITEVNIGFVRQYRIMVTGNLMVNSPESLSPYFTVSQVIGSGR